MCPNVWGLATLTGNVIICEPRTSNLQRCKKYQDTKNFAENILQVSLNQTLMNHQIKIFIIETI